MSEDPSDDGARPAEYPETPVAPADIASAGRSCSAIVILFAVILVVLCVGIAVRWVLVP